MSSEIREQTQATETKTETVDLKSLVRQIGLDSQRQPEQYLEETKVPHGGE